MYEQLNDKEIGKILKDFRLKKGLTQKEVEARLGLRERTLFDYESSRIRVSLSVAIGLCNIYETTLESLLGLKKPNSKKSKTQDNKPNNKYMPLFQTGIASKNYYIVHHKLISDPYIMTELGLNKVIKRNSPFDSLTKKITKANKRKMTVEILKYLSSLIGADGKITKEEMELKASIIDSLEFELTDNEVRAINKAGVSLYLSNKSKELFKTKAKKRFLIWVLFLAAYSDHELAPKELTYIKKVAKSLGLKNDDIGYIQENIQESIL